MSSKRKDELRRAYEGKRVLVTGHTGFKGSWLCEWLTLLGAKVHGYALPPTTTPALFNQLNLRSRIARHTEMDVADGTALAAAVDSARPDYIFHLAAQPLVRRSYVEPVQTFATNTMGTAHLLEAARRLRQPCAIVVVTTDKCYENREWLHGYREDDPLGGYDPYSASKAAAELVTAAYRQSFFKSGLPVAVASARAGNVIGGGDWAEDRIVPDCMRALERGQTITVRNANATRPWQHVVEPLGGYLRLAAALSDAQGQKDTRSLQMLCGPFNFGPRLDSNRSVGELVQGILRAWPGRAEVQSDPAAPHEAGRLMLAVDKAHHVLGWSPRWDFDRTVRETVRWYRASASPAGKRDATLRRLTRLQIRSYAGQN